MTNLERKRIAQELYARSDTLGCYFVTLKMKNTKPTKDEVAAEKAFQKWSNGKDRYHASFQTEWPAAYLAGVRAARRADIAAVKKLEMDFSCDLAHPHDCACCIT